MQVDHHGQDSTEGEFNSILVVKTGAVFSKEDLAPSLVVMQFTKGRRDPQAT